MLFMQNQGIYEGQIEAGLRLSELPEEQGGWAEYFCESEEADMRIEDPILRANTAVLLENAKRWIGKLCRAKLNEAGMYQIDEVTRSALVGGFSDYIFPIIRAAFPTNPINDLVSVQPTTRRTATVVYWNWIVGSEKGSYTPGQRLWDANVGKQDASFNFSNEVIDREVVGQGTGSSATITGTLKFHDGGGVRPGNVTLTAVVGGSQAVAYDDAQGGFLGGLTGTVDYKTGAFSITFGGNVDNGTPVIAAYRWDSEGSQMTPEVDVQIVTSSTETERRALKLNYSIESVQDIMAEFGISLEPNLVSGAAEQLNFEIARQIIHELWKVAPVVATFPKTPGAGAGYNQQDHFKDIVYPLNQAANAVWKKTQKGGVNWIVVDEQGANVVESLPASVFTKAPKPANVMGLHFIGTMSNGMRVYKDVHLDKEPGASAHGNMLLGFKGSQFFEAGFVWSPYQLFYTTDTLTTADFLSQKGLASRYATKMVNSAFYVRVNLAP